MSGLHTPKKERIKIDFKLNPPKINERNNKAGLTAQGHAELKFVQPDDDDPLMIELDDIREEDENYDVICDAIMQIKYETLMQVQGNVEIYVEGAVKGLWSKLNKKLKKKTKHLTKQVEHNQEQVKGLKKATT